MKKYVWLYAILTAMLLAGFLLFANIAKTITEQEIDYVSINEIVKQAELCWKDPNQLDHMDFAYRFAVVDSEGQIHYMSDESLPDNLSSAIQNGFIPMDITIGSSVIGKAFIEASPSGTMSKMQERMAFITLLAFILLCMLNLVFLLSLHNALVKPFKKLEIFAHKISTGRFDEPLPMNKNNVFGLFTQSFDMMRDSLLEARKRQVQAEHAKKELIASLGHDVKTPVTSIRLISELLQTVNTDPAIAEKLKTIEIKADQIDRLMNDMMHSTMEELGELKVNLSSEDSGVLRRLFIDAGHLSNIRVGVIPVCLVEIDTTRMEQVIGNIITNSYKYAGTNIDVDFQIKGELLQFDINDYGCGVESEELELITTKFYRGENAKTLHREGEGLGLYIAKLLMDKMGGGLEAFNRDNGFTIRLWIRLSL